MKPLYWLQLRLSLEEAHMGFSIRTKLFSGFGILLLFVTTIGFFGWRYISNLSSDFEDLSQNNLKASAYLAAAERGLWEMRFALPNYIVGDTKTRGDLKNSTEKWHKQINDNIKAYSALQISPTEKENLKEFEENYSTYLLARPHFFELIDSDKIDEAKEYRARETNPPASKAVQALGKLIEMEQQIGDQRQHAVAIEATNSIRLLLILIFTALAFGIVASIFISQSIINPIFRLISITNTIAQGNLSVDIQVKGNDEMGQLLKATKNMADSIGSIIKELIQSIQHLNSAANELVATATQQGSSISQQASSIQEVSTTLDEIKALANQATEKARSVLQISDRSLDVSKTGQQSLEQAGEVMAKIKSQVEAIASNILDLSERAIQIGEITSTVNDIAEQSNLLAVNAAIEATKAGEAGKGFGVVAVEVKNLASQSKQATSQVRTILSQVQKATSSTVMVTEEGSKRVEKGVHQIHQVNANIKQLYEIIVELSNAIKQISISAKQQESGIEQIAIALRQINQASNENVAGAKQQNITAHNLNQLATGLNTIVQRYRLN